MWVKIDNRLINLDSIVQISNYQECNPPSLMFRFSDTNHQSDGFFTVGFGTAERRDAVFQELQNILEQNKNFKEITMDKLIKKVKKDGEKAGSAVRRMNKEEDRKSPSMTKIKKDTDKAGSALKKGAKDTKTLMRADKKMDKKMEKCEMKSKRK